MLRVVSSNRNEQLVEALAESIHEARLAHPLGLRRVVVPSSAAVEYIKREVGLRLGVSLGLDGVFLRHFVAELVAHARSGMRIIDRTAMRFELAARFASGESLPGGALLAGFLDAPDADARGLRAWELSGVVSRALDEYQQSRPQLLRDFSRGIVPAGVDPVDGEWQAALWRELEQVLGERDRMLPLHVAIEGLDRLPPSCNGRLDVFCVRMPSPDLLALLHRLGQPTDQIVTVYVLNPCLEFWEDVDTGWALGADGLIPRGRRRRQRPAGPGADPADDNVLLRLWGRTGRDHVRQMDALGDWDSDARYVDTIVGARPTHLEQLQHQVLLREAPQTPTETTPLDDSLAFVACAGLRRELEVAAEEITRFVATAGTGAIVRTALVVPDAAAEEILALAPEVLRQAGLPVSPVDSVPQLPASLDLALRIVRVLRSRLERPLVRGVAEHPLVRVAVPHESWPELIDALGVVFGADGGDHVGTALDGDVQHWEAGINRLVAGIFIETGSERSARLGEVEVSPLASAWRDMVQAGALTELVRDLSALRARLARAATMADAVAVVDAALERWVNVSDPRDEAALGRARAALQELAIRAGATALGPAVATAAIAEAIAGLASTRPARLGHGVAVGTLGMLSQLPFDLVVLVGLSEERFPSRDARLPLDVRRQRIDGEASPAESDRYAVLERVCNTRRRLVFTRTSRGSSPGDERPASIVLSELVFALSAVIGPTSLKQLERVMPARPWDPARFTGPTPSAVLPMWYSTAVAEVTGEAPPVQSVGPLAAATGRRMRLTTRNLWSFIDNPAQTWARRMLELPEDESPDVGEVWEPLAPDPLTLSMLRNEALADHLAGTAVVDAVNRQWSERRLTGVLPPRALAAFTTPDLVSAVANTAAHMRRYMDSPQRLQVGNADRDTAAAPLWNAIELEVVDPHTHAVWMVTVGGTLDWIDLAKHVVARPEFKTDASSPVSIRSRVRAAFAAVVASAAGMEWNGRCTLFVVPATDEKEPKGSVTLFNPPEPAEARAWLTALVSDLLFANNAFRLPLAPVLAAFEAAGDDLPGFTETIENEQKRKNDWNDPRLADLPIPPDTEAHTILTRRLQPFLEMLGAADDGVSE